MLSPATMLPLLSASILAVVVTCATAYPDYSLISTLVARQASGGNGALSPSCNATCGLFAAAKHACTTPHCGCTSAFFQAQGDCLVCQAVTAEDAAAVQFLLDAESQQCHTEGVDASYEVPLSPDAEAIVQDFATRSAALRRAQTAFLALQIIGGHIGLVVVLGFAVFSRKVRRDPTFLNFCITWIFSSIVFSILLYRGTEGNTVTNSLSEVPPTKCLAQAALTNGAQVMTACATMALVIQLWLGLRGAIHGDATHGPRSGQWMTIGLLAAPYVVFFAFAIPSIFVGQQHIVLAGVPLERVIPNNFYCAIVELSPFLQAVYGVTLGLLLITVVFDVLIISVLYRHWWAFRHVQTKSAVSLSILLRVMAFSVYRIVVAVAYGTVLNRPPQIVQSGSGDSAAVTFSVPIWVDMLQAAIPLVGFLVLGVNSDMINTIMFWRRKRPHVATMQSTATTTGLSTVNSWSEKAVLDADTKYVAAA